VTFVGTRWPLFRIALKTGFLTILTLGLYRFWMKTRLRRWYWSAIRPGGLPLEYVGEPLEKLLGFLIAVVIMAFYIGIVNLLLMFASFSLLSNSFAAYAVSFAGVIPIWFYAKYRARRYVLARTRWRGVRFGLEAGAWGYAWRALLYWALTILSLGLLLPLMTFRLEKYITDRTYFGSLRLSQGGRWTMLYAAMTHVIIGGGLTVLGGVLAWNGTPVIQLLSLGVPWLLIGLIHYKVASTRILANHKSAGSTGLVSLARSGRVLRIYILGYFLANLLLILAISPLVLVAAYFDRSGALSSLILGDSLQSWALKIAGAALYFGVFLMWSVLRHALVTMPLWKHYAETLVIDRAVGLEQASQRDRDEFAEAEGFAEALDLGAAI